jgi:two-component system NtrC family sensor kinase
LDTTVRIVLIALLALVAGLTWAVLRLKRRLERSEREERRTGDELNRRLSELFSLQELSYVLSESLQLERIVDQVARYAVRFLDAQGALVALAMEGESDAEGRPQRVAAAEGTLAPLKGQIVSPDDPGLIARSLGRERLELAHSVSGEPSRLASGLDVASAAAVPLRAHGVVLGTLVVADPRDGTFAAEDMKLLSTLATHAAIVITNARFFEMAHHGKEQWQTAFDALSEGIAVVDEQGRIGRANRALAAMLGAPIPSVIGRDLGVALAGQSPALVELLTAARRGARVQPLVLRSTPLERSLRVTAARIPNPEHDQVVVLVEDVTVEQAMEAQLIQSEKLAAVGQLVSGVAHELNNPLTSIAGLSEFLLEQPELRTKDRGHLRVIHEQAERAGRIVRSLLTFARKGTVERGRVDLNEVIRRTLMLTAYDPVFKDVTIGKDLATIPEVLGDGHALQQIVLNLLNNAAQAVAGNAPDRPRVIHVSTWFDDRVRLRVADSGPGIPDDVVPQLFTPFFTTKQPGQGTGLGLSITYSIIEAHGGRITVDRPANGGAAFLVELPRAPAEAPAAAAS